jgi:fatty acid-binding protein DegV
LNLLFVLNKFDNLVRGGRMNKIVAFIASKIAIKPLCYADDGEIRIKEKIRTLEGSLKRLVVNIGNFLPSSKGKKCVICHTTNESGAKYIESLIKEQYDFKEVVVRENRGLSAFYSLEGGIIVSF